MGKYVFKRSESTFQFRFIWRDLGLIQSCIKAGYCRHCGGMVNSAASHREGSGVG